MKRLTQILLTLAATLTSLSAALADSADVTLKKGDRVVFLGDSITQAGARPGGYVSLVRDYLNEHQKDLGVTIIGAGKSGHKVPDCQQRLQRDVLSKKPDVVVIYIGINDVWHWNRGRGTKKDAFEKGLHDIIARCKKEGARVILATPSVIGEKTDGSNRFDKMLDEYSGISREVAKETGSELLDLRKQFLNHLEKHNEKNADRGILTSDTVHLNKAGNQFVADAVLVALGAKKEKKMTDSQELLRHVVLFKFKSDADPAEVKEVVDAFRRLPGQIDAIKDFEYGTDISPEKKSQGFTHCFLVTFDSEAGRDTYLPHPAHKAFVKKLRPILDDVLVFDYWADK